MIEYLNIKNKKMKEYPEGTIRTNKKGYQFIKKNGKWNYIKKPREDWNVPIKKSKKVKYNYPPIKIPDNMKETQYTGYYVTEDGKVYRKPGKYDRTGFYGEINEYGLIYLKPAYRGSSKSKKYQYQCVNISLYDEKGKFLKQIKRSVHQLVAETFVPNPNNYTEIDHIDRNKQNNCKDNLKWTTRFENMSSWERDGEYKKKLSENTRWHKISHNPHI